MAKIESNTVLTRNCKNLLKKAQFFLLEPEKSGARKDKS
jgi:hypothetical protein